MQLLRLLAHHQLSQSPITLGAAMRAGALSASAPTGTTANGIKLTEAENRHILPCTN
jgi:hypothetical protein